MADPTVVTTGTKPGLLQGVWKAIGDKGLQEAADLAELESRKTKALSSLPPGTRLSGLGSGQPSEPTTFAVESPGVAGWLDTLNPLTPSKIVTVGPAVAPSPAVADEEEVAPAPLSPMEQAAEYDDSAARAALAAEASNVGPAPAIQRYTPEAYKTDPLIEEAYNSTLGYAEKVKEAADAYQRDPLKKAADTAQRKNVADAATATEGRNKRLVDLTGERKTLSDNESKAIGEFKVDPERLYGGGSERALKTFGLSLANVFSNVGEAMQGKTGTNAIIAMIKSRVEQDIALQQQDYQRMLQGYDVKRNGLMDAIKAVGSEQGGAEALARQQILVYTGKLDELRGKLTDAQQSQQVGNASAQIKHNMGVTRGTTEAQNVAGRNVASQFNTASENAAGLATYTAGAAAKTASGQAQMGQLGIPPGDTTRIQTMLDKARDFKFHERSQLLAKIKQAMSDPVAAKEMGDLKAQFVTKAGQDPDPGYIASWAKNLALNSMSAPTRNLWNLLRTYDGLSVSALGGKAVTPIETFFFSAPKVAGSESGQYMLERSSDAIVDEMDQLFTSARLTTPQGRKSLADGLMEMHARPRRAVLPKTQSVPGPQAK